MSLKTNNSKYELINQIVSAIPSGHVATYGQIAAIAGHCTARMVGYAMSIIRDESGLPWHRVVNRKGFISRRKDGEPSSEQQKRLENEGVRFNSAGRIDLEQYGWSGI